MRGRHQPQNTSGVHLKLIFEEQTRYTKGGSSMGLLPGGSDSSPGAGNFSLGAAFAWRAASGDFALCKHGTWGCVVLVLLIFAIFAPRSFLPFPFESGGLLTLSGRPSAERGALIPLA